MTSAAAPATPGRRPWGLMLLCVLLMVLFTGLGVWQLHRRVWKLALIEAVDLRIHAPVQPAPPPADWPVMRPSQDRYRHVAVTGHFLPDADTKVQAVTALGGGFWVMSPFRDQRGFTLLINRGFEPPQTTAAPPPAGAITIDGLLRFSEPKGGFLRTNQPAAGRWYSRDVAEIAQADHLGPVAPYFIDEDANKVDYPRAGLTVVSFPNNHLVYAITWFVLALLSLGGLITALRPAADRS